MTNSPLLADMIGRILSLTCQFWLKKLRKPLAKNILILLQTETKHQIKQMWEKKSLQNKKLYLQAQFWDCIKWLQKFVSPFLGTPCNFMFFYLFYSPNIQNNSIHIKEYCCVYALSVERIGHLNIHNNTIKPNLRFFTTFSFFPYRGLI